MNFNERIKEMLGTGEESILHYIYNEYDDGMAIGNSIEATHNIIYEEELEKVLKSTFSYPCTAYTIVHKSKYDRIDYGATLEIDGKMVNITLDMTFIDLNETNKRICIFIDHGYGKELSESSIPFLKDVKEAADQMVAYVKSLNGYRLIDATEGIKVKYPFSLMVSQNG